MTNEERALLEGLHGYQKHIAEKLAESLDGIVEAAKANEQAANFVQDATHKMGALFDRMEAMESRLNAYLKEQARGENKLKVLESEVREVDKRLRSVGG